MPTHALVSGCDPRNFGGYDMVAETQATVIRTGPEIGRVTDHGPNTNYNNAKTFGQILAMIGLAGAGANDPSVVDMLLWQQCSEGYFRIVYSYTESGTFETCGSGKARGVITNTVAILVVGPHVLATLRRASRKASYGIVPTFGRQQAAGG